VVLLPRRLSHKRLATEIILATPSGRRCSLVLRQFIAVTLWSLLVVAWSAGIVASPENDRHGRRISIDQPRRELVVRSNLIQPFASWATWRAFPAAARVSSE